VVKSANPELKKATIQINVYKQHSYNRGLRGHGGS